MSKTFKQFYDNLVLELDNENFIHRDMIEMKLFHSFAFDIKFKFEIKSNKLNYIFRKYPVDIQFTESRYVNESISINWHLGGGGRSKQNLTAKIIIKDYIRIYNDLKHVVEIVDELSEKYNCEIEPHQWSPGLYEKGDLSNPSVKIYFKDLKLELSTLDSDIFIFNNKNHKLTTKIKTQDIINTIRKYKIRLYHEKSNELNKFFKELNEIKIK